MTRVYYSSLLRCADGMTLVVVVKSLSQLKINNIGILQIRLCCTNARYVSCQIHDMDRDQRDFMTFRLVYHEMHVMRPRHLLQPASRAGELVAKIIHIYHVICCRQQKTGFFVRNINYCNHRSWSNSKQSETCVLMLNYTFKTISKQNLDGQTSK